MTPEQFELIKSMDVCGSSISANELPDDRPRTLLWAAMPSGGALHVYLKDGLIHRLIGDSPYGDHRAAVSWPSQYLSVGLWYRAEYSDFDFARRMAERGHHLRWSAYSGGLLRGRTGKSFHGFVKEG